MSRSSVFDDTGTSTGGPQPGPEFGIQPHGLLLVLREPQLRIVQASTNAAAMLRRPLDSLLLATLRELDGDLQACLQALLAAGSLAPAQALRCRIGHGADRLEFEGRVHRVGSDMLALELEPVSGAPQAASVDLPGAELLARLGQDVQALSTIAAVPDLAEAVARTVRCLTGHQRVLVYELAGVTAGHVLAEARAPGLPPLVGETLAALEVPPPLRGQRLRQGVQLLVDALATPCGLVPHTHPGPEGGFDLSGLGLRQATAAQLQQWRALGATAAFTAPVAREGALWGLIVGTHPQPRQLGPGLRAAVELLAEVMATRVAAIDSYARAQTASQVRLLEQRLLDATAADGDWRRALFEDPQTLLQPLAASGAVLCLDGQPRGCGLVPAAEALPALLGWLEQRVGNTPWSCAALARESPAPAALSDSAGGVLAVRLSAAPGNLLLWLRTAQRAGEALPWTANDLALAAAFGRALVDLMLQVDAVRLLIAENHLARIRGAVARSQEAVVVVADGTAGGLYANDAFFTLAGRPRDACTTLPELSTLFADPALAHRVIGHVRAEQRAWQGELALQRPDGLALPVAVRAEPVPARDEGLLGTIFIFEDLSASKRVDAARMHLEAVLTRSGRAAQPAEGQALVGAILANASLAAMDIADGGVTPGAAPLLQEVEASTARAQALLDRIRALGEPRP